VYHITEAGRNPSSLEYICVWGAGADCFDRPISTAVRLQLSEVKLICSLNQVEGADQECDPRERLPAQSGLGTNPGDGRVYGARRGVQRSSDHP